MRGRTLAPRARGTIARGAAERGFTLVELMISAAIMSIVILGVIGILKAQTNFVGLVDNNDYTCAPAQSALWKIRNELLTTMQTSLPSPGSVTNPAAPAPFIYTADPPGGPTAGTSSNVVATSSSSPFSWIVFRPVIGYPMADASNSTSGAYYKYNNSVGRWAGCLSSNGILYQNYAQVLWVYSQSTARYGTVNQLLLDTVSYDTTTYPTPWTNHPANFTSASGSPNSTIPNLVRSIVVAGSALNGQSVSEFRLFYGDSSQQFFWQATKVPQTTYAAGATWSGSSPTYAIGVSLRVEKPSTNPNDVDFSKTGSRALVSSNWDNSNYLSGGTPNAKSLHMVVAVLPESLANAPGKPQVGP